MSTGGRSSGGGDFALGAAESFVSSTITTVLTVIPGLVIPITAAQLLATPRITLRANLPWVTSGAGAPSFVSVSILEDGVAVAACVMTMGANWFTTVPCERDAYQPAPGGHLYTAAANVGANTATCTAEEVAPLIVPTFVIEAA